MLVDETYFSVRCEGCFYVRLPLLLIVVFIDLVLFLLCIGVILDAEGNFSIQTLILHSILLFPTPLLIIIICHLNKLFFAHPLTTTTTTTTTTVQSSPSFHSTFSFDLQFILFS